MTQMIERLVRQIALPSQKRMSCRHAISCYDQVTVASIGQHRLVKEEWEHLNASYITRRYIPATQSVFQLVRLHLYVQSEYARRYLRVGLTLVDRFPTFHNIDNGSYHGTGNIERYFESDFEFAHSKH